MRIRRWLRRSCFAAAAVFGVLAVVAPTFAPATPTVNPVDTQPPQFDGFARASAIETEIRPKPGEVIPEVFRPTIPFAMGEFGSNNKAHGEAALLDPGALVTKGANLLCASGVPCSEFPVPPPPYPLKVEADYPFNPDDKAPVNGGTVGADYFQVTLGDTAAHAGQDYVESHSIATDVSLGDATAPETAFLHVGKVQAKTTLSFPDLSNPNAFVTHAEARLTDVTAFLGQLHFDSIVAESTSQSDGGQLVDSTARVRLGGATLAGHPFELGEKGLVIDGQARDDGGVADLGGALDELAESLSGSVELVGVTDEENGADTKSSAIGLHLRFLFQPDPRNSGVEGDILLGNVRSSAFTSLREIDDVTGPNTDFTPTPSGDFGPTDFDQGGTGSFDNSGGTTGGGVTEVITEGDPGQPGTEAQPPVGNDNETAAGPPEVAARGIGFLGGLAGQRIKLFYLAWTLSLLGLALGSRFRPFRVGSGR